MFSYSFLLLMSFFKSRDQVLSMTPKTQEQVDILKNVSTQYQVEISLFPPIVSDSSDSSSCESCVFLPLTRQPYGSQPHPSTSKRRPRSTSLSLQTARRPSWICYRNTPSLTSTSENQPPELALKASRILSRLLLFFFSRVLLPDANELIEMQTRNDSSDPRSSTTFYERYHSLEDVCLTHHTAS